MTAAEEAGAPDGGPIAEEAARLVEAALGWAQRAAAAVDGGSEGLATGAPECRGCPICRAVSALRDPSPELAERLTGTVTELAAMVAHGLRIVFDGQAGPDAGDDPASGSGGRSGGGPRYGPSGGSRGADPSGAGRGPGASTRGGGRRGGAQHIDIG